MALTLAALAQGLGLGVGAVSGGGVSSLSAIGIEQKISGQLDATLSRAGRTIGRYTGSSLFDALSSGAAQGNREATSQLLEAHGYNLTAIELAAVAAVALLLWIYFRRR